MEMQKYGCMLKTSSFGAILLAYDIITHEGAQNEPNLPLCVGGRLILGGGEYGHQGCGIFNYTTPG